MPLPLMGSGRRQLTGKGVCEDGGHMEEAEWWGPKQGKRQLGVEAEHYLTDPPRAEASHPPPVLPGMPDAER